MTDTEDFARDKLDEVAYRRWKRIYDSIQKLTLEHESLTKKQAVVTNKLKDPLMKMQDFWKSRREST